MLVSLLVSPSFAIVNQRLPCYALGLPVCAAGMGSYKSLLSGLESANKSLLHACPDQEGNNKFPVSGSERRNKERNRIFTHAVAPACMEKESPAPRSGSQVLAPFSTQPLPLAPSPGAALLSPAACRLPSQCRPGTAVLEVPTHPCTSSPPDSISLLWLPPSAWELTEEIPGSCKDSSHAAPCHFQFPKVLFSERQSPSIPHTHLLLFSSPRSFYPPFTLLGCMNGSLLGSSAGSSSVPL